MVIVQASQQLVQLPIAWSQNVQSPDFVKLLMLHFRVTLLFFFFLSDKYCLLHICSIDCSIE